MAGSVNIEGKLGMHVIRCKVNSFFVGLISPPLVPHGFKEDVMPGLNQLFTNDSMNDRGIRVFTYIVTSCDYKT